MEIFDEGRAAVSTQRQGVLAERDIVNQLQEHLAETQAQVDDWNFWYDQEYGSESEMVRRIKRMKRKLRKSTRCNRLDLQQGSFNQHLSPLPLCKGMFVQNYYLLHRFLPLLYRSLQFNPV